MKLARRLAAHALAAIGALAFPTAGTASAQIALTVTTLQSAPGTSTDSTPPAPIISFAALPLPPALGIGSVQIVASFDAAFAAPFFVRNFESLSGQIVLDSLLPAKTRVFYRARLFDQQGNVQAQATVSHPVRSWLALVSPARVTDVLFTRQPTFTWSSPPITLPPGPWQYTLTITNNGLKQIEREYRTLSDTSFVPPIPLDACTSFSWSVTARAVNGPPSNTITLTSPGSFVIQSAECPSATIFYQNFPNPFGRGEISNKTCFWFDLANRSAVRLTIYDVRLREVRNIVPGALTSLLDAGAYGRPAPGDASGCDPRLSWDGTDDRGRTVPTGVYIAVFTADGKRETKKVFFKAP